MKFIIHGTKAGSASPFLSLARVTASCLLRTNRESVFSRFAYLSYITFVNVYVKFLDCYKWSFPMALENVCKASFCVSVLMKTVLMDYL